VFADASLSVPQDNFLIEDVAYFGASVQSTQARIESRTLKPNSVCFQPEGGQCFYVAYSVLPSSNGKEPVFAVDLAAPGNDVYFSSIEEPTTFTVKSTVLVDFVGAKGLNKRAPSTQSVQTVATAVIGGNSAKIHSGAVTSYSSLSLVTLIALLMCLLWN